MNEERSSPPSKMGVWETIKHNSGTAKDRKNQCVFVFWIIGWAISLVVVGLWLKSDNDLEGAILWGLAMFPAIFAVGALLSYLRFLRETDEFLRKIQLDGLAIGFGVGVMVAVGYQLFEKIGAPVMRADDLATIMLIAWGLGQLYAMLRYR